jgi:hypothetical protein
MATFIGGGDAAIRQGLAIPPHDYYSNTYTDGNLTQTVYKRGGASGVTVATVTYTYDVSNKILTATVS